MAIKATEITVGTTPTLLARGGSFTDPIQVALRDASADMFVGGPDVDTSDGFPFNAADGSLSFELHSLDDLYAIVASGTATVRVIQTRG